MHESIYTHDDPVTWPKSKTSARAAIYRRVSYSLLGKLATRAREGWNADQG
jgi:hypothetical protein